jgi:hypothetical protein
MMHIDFTATAGKTDLNLPALAYQRKAKTAMT